uniref:Uncharacterized protein n=1 Tax=Loa loa TaxID=7209 RepID=A0A1I7VMS6_LOALO
MQKRSEKMQAILHDIARWDRSNAAGVFQRNGDSAYRMGGVRASDESTPRRDSAGKREIGLEQCLIPRMA